MSVSNLAERITNAKQLDFCFNLERKRKELGLSQKELDKLCGFTSRDSITRKVESGEISPSLRQIIKLCKALNCSSSELVGV